VTVPGSSKQIFIVNSEGFLTKNIIILLVEKDTTVVAENQIRLQTVIISSFYRGACNFSYRQKLDKCMHESQFSETNMIFIT
jgi:hypothetical protein